MKKNVLLILVLVCIISCKEQDKLKDNAAVPVTTANTSEKDAYYNVSLDSLLALYKSNANNPKLKNAILARHEIEREEFLTYTYTFWAKDVYMDYIIYDAEKVISMGRTNETTANVPFEYLCFNPSSKHDADDINYTPIARTSWKPDTSCYPIALFQIIAESHPGCRLLATKGYQYTPVPTNPGEEIIINKYVGSNIVLFEVIDADGSPVAYYDISHDPGN